MSVKEALSSVYLRPTDGNIKTFKKLSYCMHVIIERLKISMPQVPLLVETER